MLNDADFAATAALPADAIAVRGAREHNLKNLDVDIPRGRFVVVTGVSGSGKSTLAFDLLFAEGQRRFLDSMSAYARQFVEQLARPDVDLIAGLPPTVSIEQSTTRGGGKSTVATVTEIYHFIRLLFARLGTQHCPDCDLPVEAQTRDELRATLEAAARERGELTLLAPVIRNRKGFHSEVADWARKHGYEEIRADGKWYRTDQPFRLDRFKEHDLEVVVGTLTAGSADFPVRSAGRTGKSAPLTPDSRQLVDDALRLGKGVLHALDKRGRQTVHSTDRSCPKCRRSFAPLDPKNFSYNSSQGWCPKCRGFGELFYIPEVERGANADSVEENWWRWAEGKREVCPECHGARLKPEARAVRLAMSKDQLPVTKTSGKNPKTGSLVIGHRSFPTITDLATLTVDAAFAWAEALRLEGRSAEVARDILPEIRERLRFLREVGLGYLQLGRGVITLSGGEGQRIRLAAQLGSNLSGVLYVLDEPTIGLHNRDNDRLLDCLHQLRDRGNSLVVVEHDEETMRRADYIIDLGPGAGVNGGQVVAAGTVAELLRHPESLTGQMLKALETKTYPTRGDRRPVSEPAGKPAGGKKKAGRATAHPPTCPPAHFLTLHRAAKNNLKDLTVHFPLGRFIAVTGVSGSGKSTLIKECLFPAVEAALKLKVQSSRFKVQGSDLCVTGFESLNAVHEVDQSPIGRTPRSTPATYVGFFDDIRQLFASATEAKLRGYGPGRFSFNSAQGRCPDCEGKGVIELEMNFLPTAQVRCERCGGRRFNPETLDVQWNGKSIADVLNLSVAEGLEFFAAHRKLLRPLEALHDTGLDYLRLGQTSPTLSGGEAQRIKLVTHLLGGLKSAANAALEVQSSKFKVQSSPKRDLFILEEPTIGLHMQDVRRLVEVLQRLVDAGHTVVVIEHNLDLIAEADWVIDLGPEGGDAGGQIVAEGTPEQVAAVAGSHTGRYLCSLVARG